MKLMILSLAALAIATNAEELKPTNLTENMVKEKREAPAPQVNENSEAPQRFVHQAKASNQHNVGVSAGYQINPAQFNGNPHDFGAATFGIAPQDWNSHTAQLQKLSLANLNFAQPGSHADLAGLSVVMGNPGSHGSSAPSFTQYFTGNGLGLGQPQASLSAAVQQALAQAGFDSHHGAQQLAPLTFGAQPQHNYQFAKNSLTSAQPQYHFAAPLQVPQHYAAGHQGLGSFGGNQLFALAPSYGSNQQHGQLYFPAEYSGAHQHSGPVVSASNIKGQKLTFGEHFLNGYKKLANNAKLSSFGMAPSQYDSASQFKPSTFLGAGYESAPSQTHPVKFAFAQQSNKQLSESLGPVKFGDSFSSPAFSGQSAVSFAPNFAFSMNKLPLMGFGYQPDSHVQASNKYSFPAKLVKTSNGYKILESEKKLKQSPSFKYSGFTFGNADTQGSNSDNTYNTIKYSTDLRPRYILN